VLPQREDRLRKSFIVFYADWPSEIAWFFTPQEDQIKTTVCLVLYKWAVHTTVCVPVSWVATMLCSWAGNLCINLFEALSEDLAQYKARWPSPAILGVTHTVVCTAHLYSTKHTVVLIWSSLGVKNHATSFLFSLFFQNKIYKFFFKTVFYKKCQKCWDCIPIYYEAC